MPVLRKVIIIYLNISFVFLGQASNAYFSIVIWTCVSGESGWRVRGKVIDDRKRRESFE